MQRKQPAIMSIIAGGRNGWPARGPESRGSSCPRWSGSARSRPIVAAAAWSAGRRLCQLAAQTRCWADNFSPDRAHARIIGSPPTLTQPRPLRRGRAHPSGYPFGAKRPWEQSPHRTGPGVAAPASYQLHRLWKRFGPAPLGTPRQRRQGLALAPGVPRLDRDCDQSLAPGER